MAVKLAPDQLVKPGGAGSAVQRGGMFRQQTMQALAGGAPLFAADEKTALARLRAFCQQAAADYEGQRDFPAVEGTSRLSPCLAIGVLSPRQCLHRLLTEHPAALDGGAG